MRLLSIEQTTILRLGVLSRPDGQIFLPDAISALQEKFKFNNVPDIKTARPESLEFLHGQHESFTIGSLGIYNDGMVVKSQSDSRQLDDFVSYLEEWAKHTFDIRFHPSMTVKNIYESALVVQSDAREIKFFKRLSKIEKILAEKLASDSEIQCDVDFNGFSLSLHPKNLRIFKPTPFKLEQRVGSEPNVAHWFSLAPLSTQSHLELLAELAALP